MTDPTSSRPLVTFALLAYNQEKYVREAVEGAFAQTYEPLEVILSDDCSKDRTFEIMRRIAVEYDGPHRVLLNRNPVNQGLCGHVNTAFRLARGRILVMAAGDDISLPDRVSITADVFNRYPDVLSVSMEYRCMNEGGLTLPVQKKFPEGKYSLQNLLAGGRLPSYGCTRAYRSCLMEKFGPLRKSCRVEDAPLRLRALLVGHIYHSNAQGILYRRHSAAISNSIQQSGQLGVYRQYLYDLKCASSTSMLKEEQLREAKRALRSAIIRGLVLAKFQTSRRPVLSFLAYVLPSSHIAIKEKVVLFYEALKRLTATQRDSHGLF